MWFVNIFYFEYDTLALVQTDSFFEKSDAKAAAFDAIVDLCKRNCKIVEVHIWNEICHNTNKGGNDNG